MNPYLMAAGIVSATIGIIHSVLGEYFILTRLGWLPPVMGSELFTSRILRFAWHITTLLLFGMGLVLVLQACGRGNADLTVRIFSVTFLLCAILSGGISRGKHFSWVLFLVASILLWYGAPTVAG
jgi:hypothetical protein